MRISPLSCGLRLAAVVAVVSAGCALAAEPSPPVTIVAGGAGGVTAIAGWRIRSSTDAQQGGRVISRADFDAKDWYPVGARSTVFAGMLANGRYTRVFHGTRLRHVNRQHYQIPWWYRTEFRLPDGRNLRTFIRIKGIIPRADVWLNGVRIADRHDIAGAFTVHEIDVTGRVRPGINTLAVHVYPANPERDLALGWIDWNPAPPDNNMGIWRDVEIVRTGPVSLHGARVTSRLSLPGLDRADLVVKVDVRNAGDAPLTATVAGRVADVDFARRVRLQPHQVRTVEFNPSTNPGLRLADPRVWWPAGMGVQPLYHLAMTAKVEGALSDRAAATFGIREVSSHLTRDGDRQFVVNGEPLLIRGAGWAPDLFLRDRPRRLESEFRYVRNLGLNAIRTEGKLERKKFYDLADRYGIMILPGWECCDKWEAWAGTGGEPWSDADKRIARESMLSEARALRNHPSVIGFLIGSDVAPPPDIAKIYTDALHAADWPDPIVSAASARTTGPSRPSGLKMSGPYAWVPPAYWYADKRGGAFGFNSETSAGIDIPALYSLKQMLSPDALKKLWRDFDARQYHAAPAWSPFSSLKRFDTALAHRYGQPKSLADYVEKAQLANYEATRAQFEAYSARMSAARPATGVIYWMLNSAWPSLHWHLFNAALEPAGAYYGAKKANEPLHIQYGYDDHSVVIVNHTRRPAADLAARVRVYDLEGRVRYDKRLAGIAAPTNHATELVTIPRLANLSGTYFVELTLADAAGHELSRNVYWLSTRPDVLDWKQSTWYVTPVSRYADFTELEQLPAVDAVAGVSTHRQGEMAVITVTVSNPAKSKAVALFQHASVRRGDGTPVLPVYWSDNDVTLWPGESVTLTARYPAAALHGVAATVQLGGWNVEKRTIPAR